MSESEAVPVAATLAEVFFDVLELVLADVGAGVGALAEVPAALDFASDLLAGAGAAVAAGAVSPLAFLLLLVFFGDAVLELSPVAAGLAGASADAGAVAPASRADFFLPDFVELPASVLADLSGPAVASALFLLLAVLFELPEFSVLVLLSASCVASADFLLFLLLPELSDPAACSAAAAWDDFFELFLEVVLPELSLPESGDLVFLDDFFVVSEDSAD